MIAAVAFLASLALVVGYWCLISFATFGLWWLALTIADKTAPVRHPHGHPLVCIRGETVEDVIAVLLEEIAA